MPAPFSAQYSQQIGQDGDFQEDGHDGRKLDGDTPERALLQRH
jgi:hypothetical protein